MGRGLGASGAFTTAVATAVHQIAPAHAENNAFYAEYLGDGSRSPLKDWLVFEVLGVFVGGFLSGVLANRLKLHRRERAAHHDPVAADLCLCRRRH